MFDQFLTMEEVAKRFPTKSGKPRDPSTPYRWCTKGVNGVYLKYEQIGRTMYTTMEYLYMFSKELKEARKRKNIQSSRKRRKDKDEIYKKNLRKYGLDV